MPNPDGASTPVFVSFSHRDKKWLERLRVHLKPLVRTGDIDLWDDTRIHPGADWKAEIDRALASARVAVLLISPDFLASDFIQDQELPLLLEAAERRGTLILPVILGHSLYARSPLSRFHAVNAPDQPLANFPKAGRDKFLRELARAIAAGLPAAGLPDKASEGFFSLPSFRVSRKARLAKKRKKPKSSSKTRSQASTLRSGDKATDEARFVNVWIETGDCRLEVGVAREIGVDIGPARGNSVGGGKFKFDWGERVALDLMIALDGPDVRVTPSWHLVKLWRDRALDPVYFDVIAQCPGVHRLSLSLYLSRELSLVEKYWVYLEAVESSSEVHA